MPINAKLVVVGGEVKTAEIKLRLPCTIGRGRGCTIMLPQALVSRQHCELFETGGQMMVRDLGSLNGTFVNNQKIADPSPIRSEELLTIGTVTFRVVYEGASASSPPAGTGPAKRTASAGLAPTNDDDSAHPLEIGDFDFETESPAAPGEDAKTPFGMPDIQIGEKTAATPAVGMSADATKSAPPAAATIPVAKPITSAAKQTTPAAKPVAPAKPATPAVAAPAPPAVPAAEDEEEEDDFKDFLKSLGK